MAVLMIINSWPASQVFGTLLHIYQARLGRKVELDQGYPCQTGGFLWARRHGLGLTWHSGGCLRARRVNLGSVVAEVAFDHEPSLEVAGVNG